MSSERDSESQIESILERLRAGDDSAREDLLKHCEKRLHYIAHGMLKGFRTVGSFEQTDDVLNKAMMGMWKSLRQVHPDSPEGFIWWARKRIRWVLLDFAKKYRGKQPPLGGSQGSEEWTPGITTLGPSSMGEWVRLHELVDELEGLDCKIFHLRFYEGRTFAQIARELNIPPSTANYRWQRALERVRSGLEDYRKGFDD